MDQYGSLVVDRPHSFSLLFCPQSPLLCISPPGGAHPDGSHPTLATRTVPPLPPNWYYILAGGGAILILATAVLAVAICSQRRHHMSTQMSLPATAHYSPQTSRYPGGCSSGRLGADPALTVWLDKEDGYSHY